MTIAAMPRAELVRLASSLAPEDARDVYLARMRTDVLLFAAMCLPGAARERFSRMHLAFFEAPKVRWTDRTGVEVIADAAPREGAKSTVETYIQVLHDIAHGLEPFVAIVSATKGQADQLVKRLHASLALPEAAPELHEMFGPFEIDGGQTDFVVHCPGGCPGGTRVASYSVGGQIRGQLHGNWRPSKVIVDDFETPQGAISPIVRSRVWDYWVSDIRKCGGPYTIYRCIGTILHPDSMLSRVLKSPNTRARRWQAIERWPDLDCWRPVRELWADLTDPDRLETARAYYLDHRDELDAGAVVLWPEQRGLFDLMCEYWEDVGAFLKERQNEPRDPEQQIFDIETLRRCRWDGERVTTSTGRVIPISQCEVSVFLDPVPPKNGVEKGDFAALAIVAMDRHGYRYVLECHLTRGAPSAQRDLMWQAFERFGPRAYYGYEANGFAALSGEAMDIERAARERAGRVYSLFPREEVAVANKNARIARMEPSCVNGHLEWAESLPAEVLSQLREFPTGAHDDGPDAIEQADAQLRGGRIETGAGVPW